MLLAGSSASLFAQADTSDNYVKKFLNIPAIQINMVPDSAVYSNKNLKKNEALVIIFFNPDCDHCQKETKELLAYKNELKGVQILMVSPAPFGEIKKFYDEYGLASLPDMKVGQDLNYKLAGIYKVKTYPSIYVYDNRGTLAKAFVGNIGIPAVLDAIK